MVAMVKPFFQNKRSLCNTSSHWIPVLSEKRIRQIYKARPTENKKKSQTNKNTIHGQ